MKHTKGPWEWQIDIDKHVVIFNEDGDIVLRDGEYMMNADAAFVVDACNKHASARAIMQKFVDKVDSGLARSTETYAEMKEWLDD